MAEKVVRIQSGSRSPSRVSSSAPAAGPAEDATFVVSGWRAAPAGSTVDLAELPESVRALLLQGRPVRFELEPPQLADVRRNALVALDGDGQSGESDHLDGTVPAHEPSVTEDLRESAERFRSLVQHSSDVVTLVDADTTIRYQTPSVARVLGYDPSDLVGLKLLDLLHPDDVPYARAFFAQTLQGRGVSPAVEWRMRHRDGGWLHLETIANNLLHDATVGHLVLNTRDISERKALEHQLAHQAFHDPLTDLANRALFKNRVERALLARRRSHDRCVVLFLDLDDFKKVNDSLGHVVGDDLLVAVARRVRACLRPSDTAARLGGDEFAILLDEARSPEEGAIVAERILEALRSPFTLQGKETFIETSVGIAISDPKDGADELLRNADIAMYMAKNAGKGRYVTFHAAMHAAALERLELESDLRHAVERGEFVLHYQPIAALGSGKLVGVEALLRWEHPERGLLGPADFISLVEETGLILPIGRWVMREACRQAASWHRRYGGDSRLLMSINLSGKQLEHPGLVAELESAIQEFGIDPHTLILEITESVMMNDTETTVAQMTALRKLGARLSIDDFGTGYSSLHYLHSFPLDIVKIAKPFVDGLSKDPQKEAFTRTIVELCRTLRLQALAEGVESTEQAEQLRRLGCELGQGNYLAEPLDESGMTALLGAGGAIAAYAAEVDDFGRSREADWWHKILGGRPRSEASEQRDEVRR